MADVSSLPFVNYSQEAALPQQTQANTALAQQQAGLVNQQTQAAAMQNQIQRASVPLILRAMNDAAEDQSGANPGAPVDKGSDATGVGGAWYDTNNVETTLRNQNFVAPYTAQELQMLKASKMLSIADPQRGKAMFDNMNAQRQARIEAATAANQLKMGNTYDVMGAIADADPDTALDMMKRTAPQSMDTISKLASADGIDLGSEVKKFAGHVAAVSHLYSGRPTSINNGQLIDDKTAQPVVGQTQAFTGLGAADRQKEWDRATETIKYTTPDNVEHSQERWRAPVAYGGYGGKLTPAQAVLAADQAARQGAAGGPTLNTGEAATAAANTGMGPTLHGAAAAAKISAKRTAAVPAPGTTPTAGTDIGTLPGVNPAALPKVVNPTAGQGPGSAGTAGTKNLESMAARTNDAINTTRDAGVDAAKMRSLLNQAKTEVAHINPRVVGPGSTLYNAMLKTYTAAAGTAPNALIDEGSLDKFLNQIGAQNVRQLLAGQKITNQEMMTFLTRGSPSISMPLGGISRLLNYLDAENEYTMRYNRTKMMGLKAGADPDLIDSELENRVPRTTFVQQRTKSTDALSPTTSTPPKYSDAQIAKYARVHGMTVDAAKTHLGIQ